MIGDTDIILAIYDCQY